MKAVMQKRFFKWNGLEALYDCIERENCRNCSKGGMYENGKKQIGKK